MPRTASTFRPRPEKTFRKPSASIASNGPPKNRKPRVCGPGRCVGGARFAYRASPSVDAQNALEPPRVVSRLVLVLDPRVRDGVPAPERFVLWPEAIGRVRGEQRLDVGAIVRRPRLLVSLHPTLEVASFHRFPPHDPV